MDEEKRRHAEICPVCSGSGKYRRYYTIGYSSSGENYTESTCHGCNGKGWVTITD